MIRFANRRDAGRQLAKVVRERLTDEDTIVLALPRGGVPVGYEVARALEAPLDIFVVRKLGVPGHEELAMGAIASGGVTFVDTHITGQLGITDAEIAEVVDRERVELARRERAYREGRPSLSIAGKTVTLVDDGLATGATMKAAAMAVEALAPRRVVIAVPVASAEACRAMTDVADDIICAVTPEPFRAVGLWYDDFGQTNDEEVRALLAAASEELGRPAAEARYARRRASHP
ncbi:MAG: phosphoribosyltransferase [Deltaproteobacteria bacterium]|nr:phosphoribosyltransferase [Deltaproteobacteria bacterium]